MRVLLDNCLPHSLPHELTEHDVQTAKFAGFNGLSDPGLLATMEGAFDVLVICDQGIPWQLKVDRGSVAVVVLFAPTDRQTDLLPLVPALLEALDELQPGDVREVGRQPQDGS